MHNPFMQFMIFLSPYTLKTEIALTKCSEQELTTTGYRYFVQFESNSARCKLKESSRDVSIYTVHRESFFETFYSLLKVKEKEK